MNTNIDSEKAATGQHDSSVVPVTDPPPDENVSQNEDLPHGLQLFILFVGLVLSILLVALDTTIIATAIPEITNEFHSLDQVGWYGSAYFLTNAAFQCFWGKAYTYFDMKATFVTGIGVFEIGTLICALSNDSNTFIAGRAIAGLGGAALGSGAFSIIAIVARPERRAMYIGFMGATYGVASVIGPILGGLFTQYAVTSHYTGWRWCFWMNLPIGVTATIMVTCFFKPPHREIPYTLMEKLRHMDLPAVGLILGAMVLYLLPMRWAGVVFAWNSAPIIGSLTGAFILLLFFGVFEWRAGERALVPFRFFRNRQITLNLLYMFFLSGLYMPAVYYISIQFQALQNKTPTQAGIQSISLVLSVSLGTILANTCISHFPFSSKIWLTSGPLLATTGMILIYVLGANASLGTWIGLLIFLGLGIGFALQTPISINQSLVQPADIPIIVSITLFFEESGSSALIAASEAAFSNQLIASLLQQQSSSSSPNTNLDPATVLQIGASQLRSQILNAEQLSLVLSAYQHGLDASYVVMFVSGCITVLFSVGILVLAKKNSKTTQGQTVAE